MFVAFDVNPAVVRFVVVTAFDTYKFPVMLADAFERVMVFAKRLVVVRAFAAYKLLDRERLARFATETTFRVPTLARGVTT